MKLCKECKFAAFGNGNWFCDCPKNRIQSIVDGYFAHRIQYCETHRKHGYLTCRTVNSCGKEGRWWEPKEANR